MDQLASRDFALDGIEEADEFAVTVALRCVRGDPEPIFSEPPR
jgi:hypothetical protein